MSENSDNPVLTHAICNFPGACFADCCNKVKHHDDAKIIQRVNKKLYKIIQENFTNVKITEFQDEFHFVADLNKMYHQNLFDGVNVHGIAISAHGVSLLLLQFKIKKKGARN